MHNERCTTGSESAVASTVIPRARALTPIGTALSLSAKFEAFTWVGLLVGMYFKYVAPTTYADVRLFGRPHGAVFIVYFVVTIAASLRLRWRWWAVVRALLAAFPPLATYPLEVWFRRRVLLESSRS